MAKFFQVQIISVDRNTGQFIRFFFQIP